MFCVVETLEHDFDEYAYEQYERVLFVGSREECEEVSSFVEDDEYDEYYERYLDVVWYHDSMEYEHYDYEE